MRLPPGLTFLDHTADVAIALEAPSLDALFHRAALGMLALLRGEDDEETPAHARGGSAAEEGPSGLQSTSISISREGEDSSAESGLAEILLGWLRELLFLHQTDHRDYVESDFERLDPTELRARVRTEPSAGAVREIKGVTYHDLMVEPDGNGWKARVIFDV